ncbi:MULTISPECIES: CBS domain-containing protein [unclassified Lentilitoribacter]|jgi:CBS domain-containing protein|uniref:CBS domain-containing protein n=1 Tax=unclassified Lentilitoribacter TaxID=2647570 RepID=UPI0013A6A2D8|nr:CBS domain-containing protein [Lentilitoribacter sp. Alg239-R112]
MTVKHILDDKGYDVSSISGDETIIEAADFLAGNKIGAVVVSSSEKEIAGILSERDIVRAVSQHGKEVLDRPLSTIMTKNVRTCDSGYSIMKVMELMTEGGFRHLPIVDDGKLLGIISIRDVIKYRMQEVEREAEDIKSYIAAG